MPRGGKPPPGGRPPNLSADEQQALGIEYQDLMDAEAGVTALQSKRRRKRKRKPIVPKSPRGVRLNVIEHLAVKYGQKPRLVEEYVKKWRRAKKAGTFIPETDAQQAERLKNRGSREEEEKLLSLSDEQKKRLRRLGAHAGRLTNERLDQILFQLTAEQFEQLLNPKK
jgi:hypothetical protein